MFQMSKQKTCLFNISTFSKPLQSADGIQKSKGRMRRGGRKRKKHLMEVAQGRNKFMSSTFTPFLIYLRYKNSVIWPVCFPNKHFYLQQIKSRPTSCGTDPSHSPSGDCEHRPEPSAASHKHGCGGRAAEVEGKTPPHSIFNQILWWSSILSFNHSPQLHTDSISDCSSSVAFGFSWTPGLFPHPKEEPHLRAEWFLSTSMKPSQTNISPLLTSLSLKISIIDFLIVKITEKQLANKA